MKTAQYFLLQFKNAVRSRVRAFVYLLMSFVLLTVVCFSAGLSQTANDCIDANMVRRVENREFELTIDKTQCGLSKQAMLSALSHLPHVESANVYYEPVTATLGKNDVGLPQVGLTLNSGTVAHLPAKVTGQTLDANASHRILLQDSLELEQNGSVRRYPTEKLIGKTLTFLYTDAQGKTRRYSAVVSGVYKADEDTTNDAFLPLSDLYSILAAEYGVSQDKLFETDEEMSFRVVVDEYKRVKPVKNAVRKLVGETAASMSDYVVFTGNSSSFHSVSLVSTALCVVVFLILLVTLFVMTGNYIHENLQEVAVSRALGYSRGQTTRMLLTQILLLDVIVLLLSFAASFVLLACFLPSVFARLIHDTTLVVNTGFTPMPVLLAGAGFLAVTAVAVAYNCARILKPQPAQLLKTIQGAA